MSNALQLTKKELVGQEEIKVLRETYFKDFTDAEVNFSVAVSNELRLSPLLRQIHFVKRAGKIVPQTGIDGFRLTAERTGRYAGSDDAVFEYGADKKIPSKATVTVYKIVDGQRCAFTASARWEEYSVPNEMWRKMPNNQLAKCAEALALRKAFPAELSALRTDEEMDQADGPSKAEQVQARVAPKPTDIETTATEVTEPTEALEPEEIPNCSLCGAEMKISKAGTTYYCPNFNDKSKGEHPRIKI